MGYSRAYPQNIAPKGTNIQQGFENDDKEFKRIYDILSNNGSFTLAGSKRQSILYGPTDSSGNPNFLTTSGLAVSIDGSTKPVILAFANGFSPSAGTVDIIDKIDTVVNNAWTFPANSTCYLYVDKDIATGLLSYGYTTLPDQYLRAAPINPILNQHYFNTIEMKMYCYNGSAWDVKQRVFVGKVVAGINSSTATAYPVGSRCPLQISGIYATGAINETRAEDIASAAVVDLGALEGNFVSITGTTAINSFGTSNAGTRRLVKFTGVLTLTYNAISLILPGAVNITTAAGDTAEFVSLGSGNWQCIRYTRADGSPLSQLNIPSFSNLKIIVTSNTTATITADRACLLDLNGNGKILSGLNLALATGTVGANGIDTGPLAASTWYYLFAIYNPTTQISACLMSLSATAPTLPSGYSCLARVGAVRLDSNKYLFKTIQFGNKCNYISNSSPLPSMANGVLGTWSSSTPSYSAISTSSFVPQTASSIIVLATANSASTGMFAVAPNNSYSGVTSASPPPLFNSNNANNSYGSVFGKLTLESGYIYAVSNSGSINVQCYGWEDNL